MRAEDWSQIEITSLSELDRAIGEASSRFEGLFALWRGHANLGWALRAEVFREARYQEVFLVRSFMAHAESPRQPCPTEEGPIWATAQSIRRYAALAPGRFKNIWGRV